MQKQLEIQKQILPNLTDRSCWKEIELMRESSKFEDKKSTNRCYFFHLYRALITNLCQNLKDNWKSGLNWKRNQIQIFLSLNLRCSMSDVVECKAENTLPILWGAVYQKIPNLIIFPNENQPIFVNTKNASDNSETCFTFLAHFSS